MTNTEILTNFVIRENHPEYIEIVYYAKDVITAKLATADLRALNNGHWHIARRADRITLTRVA